MKLGWVAVALLVTIAGCTSWQTGLIQTAAFEHDCRDEDVHIVEVLETSGAPRAVRLDVCGDERIYRHTVSGWLDFTNAVQTREGDVAPTIAPPQRSSADVRALLRELNPGVMECTDGAPLSPHLTLDATGHLTEISGLPENAAQQACLRTLFGRVHLPGEAAPMTFTPHFAAP